MRKTRKAANPSLIIEQEEPFVPSKGWAEMIHIGLRQRRREAVDSIFWKESGIKDIRELEMVETGSR